MQPRVFQTVVGLALVLYAASLFLPAFDCGSTRPFIRFPDSNEPSGFGILALGWLGLLAWDPRWFANPIFIVMAIHLMTGSRWKKRVIYPVLATGAAISCLFIPAAACGPHYHPSQGLAIGGWFWVISLIAISAVYSIRYWKLFLDFHYSYR